MRPSRSLALSLLLAAQGCGGGVSLVRYSVGGAGSSVAEEGRALLCRPAGEGPFPVVVYVHGKVVDLVGYREAGARGYDLEGICRALAADGFLAFAPLRESGGGNLPGHEAEVTRALDYVRALPDVDASRIALVGFSRGGMLALRVGLEREDVRALVLLAPAPGRGRFAEAVEDAASLDAPVLLLVEASDDAWILADVDTLERALRRHGKDVRTVRYDRGGGHRLFWTVGYYWEDVRDFLREKLGR